MIVCSAGVGSFHIGGYILLLLSNFVWMYYCYFNTRLQYKGISSIILFYQLFGTMIILLPAVLINPISTQAFFRWEIVFGILFLALVNGVVAYLLLIYSLKALDVVTTNIINNFIPIVTLGINYVLYHENITVMQFIGTVFAIAAVIIPSLDLRLKNNN